MGTARTLPTMRIHPLRVLAALLAALVAGWLVVGVGGPAAAHDTLLESDPADGSTVPEVPEQAVLTFSANPTPQGAEALVIDADGTETPLPEPVLDGRTATWDLTGVSEGSNEIVWTVISSDGHRIDGTITFVVATADGEPTNELTSPGEETETDGTASDEASSDDGAASDEASSEDAPGATGTEPADGDRSDVDDAADTEADDDSGSWLPGGKYTAIIGGVAIALAILAAVWFVVIRRRGTGADTPDDD